MKRWCWRAQCPSLLRWMQQNATLHTPTLQPISTQQLQTPTGTSLLKRRAEERWFCKTVMSHDIEDTLLTSEEPEGMKHNFFHPLKTDDNDVHDAMYELFAAHETKSGTHDSHMEVQSREICNMLSSEDSSSIQERLQPFVMHLSPCLVVRVLNQLTNVETERFFFYWAAKQDGYKHDISVYHTLLLKLLQAKHWCAVWKLLKKMQSEDCAPTSTTFDIIIKNFGEAGSEQQCWRAFEEAERLGVKLDAHVYTGLMRLLFDRKNVAKAKHVFGKMKEHNLEVDIHTWSTLIHGLCKNIKMAAAENFLNQMQTSGCMPNDDIYNTMIAGFCESSDPKKAFSMYELMQKQGVRPNTCTYNTLIKAYCSLHMFVEVDGIISNMQDAGCELDQATFNILLEGLLEKGKTIEAAKLFSKMHNVGLVDSSSYRIYTSYVRRLGGESKLVAFSEKLFAKYGTCDVEVCNAILQHYCELGELSKASKYLDEALVRLSAPNETSCVLMIDALCKSGDVNEARSLLSSMEERGCKATDMSYRPVVIALCKHSEASEALQLFEEMNEKGIQASSATCQHLLQALSDAGSVDAVIRLCNYSIERRHFIDRFTAFAFAKCLNKAKRLEEVIVLVRAMRRQGCLPKGGIFKYALGSMVRGELDEVQKYLHGQMPNIITYKAMLIRACKKGKLEKAKSIFAQMKVQECGPNWTCYNYLILALSKSEDTRIEAFELFEEMVERGVAPLKELHNILMNTFCRAEQHDLIMKLGKLIIAMGLTIKRGAVSFLLQQADASELKKLYFELNDSNCLAESVATDDEEDLELDGSVATDNEEELKLNGEAT